MGIVTIMDAQSDGHRFYREPDGTVNLGKVITPDGDIISYEEYQRRRGIVPEIIVEPLQLHVIPEESQITMPIADMQSVLLAFLSKMTVSFYLGGVIEIIGSY
jgi:hypothetical protein